MALRSVLAYLSMKLDFFLDLIFLANFYVINTLLLKLLFNNLGDLVPRRPGNNLLSVLQLDSFNWKIGRGIDCSNLRDYG